MNRVKQLRLMQGLTQEELAERANISVSYLCEIETARVMPSLKVLKKIASVLKLPVLAVLDSEGNGVGYVGTNNGNNFNNFGNNYGTNNFAIDSSNLKNSAVSNDSPASPVQQASDGMARKSSVCPFAYMDACDGNTEDVATLMIMAILPKMSAENKQKLLLYAAELV